MTERESGDFPDGSVGRYVRERWGAPHARPPAGGRGRGAESPAAPSPTEDTAEVPEHTASNGAAPEGHRNGSGPDRTAPDGAVTHDAATHDATADDPVAGAAVPDAAEAEDVLPDAASGGTPDDPSPRGAPDDLPDGPASDTAADRPGLAEPSAPDAGSVPDDDPAPAVASTSGGAPSRGEPDVGHRTDAPAGTGARGGEPGADAHRAESAAEPHRVEPRPGERRTERHPADRPTGERRRAADRASGERLRSRRVAPDPSRRTARERPISWPRDDDRSRHAATDEARGGSTGAGGRQTDPTPAPATDGGAAELAAARGLWEFETTEIRPAAPRPSAPTLDVPPGLSTERLLRRGRRIPQSGWRYWIYRLSGRMINPGESPAERHRRELMARINVPLIGSHKIAMLSLKGGVGKTTVTATLGATFASMRGDRVIAVDANPDRGTLSQKIPLETSATVRHLLRDAQRVRRYTDVRAYTSQGPSRLEVLASEQDPAVSEAFGEQDYRRTITLLEHFYNIVLTDCGTGLMHSAMYGVLGLADQLVIVSSGSIDGARSASATMDWLDAHGHADLVSNAVAVINSVHRRHGPVHLERVAEHFAARCRSVVRIPFDPHLEEGAEVDLDRLEPHTRIALLELAAAVADSFASSQPRP